MSTSVDSSVQATLAPAHGSGGAAESGVEKLFHLYDDVSKQARIHKIDTAIQTLVNAAIWGLFVFGCVSAYPQIPSEGSFGLLVACGASGVLLLNVFVFCVNRCERVDDREISKKVGELDCNDFTSKERAKLRLVDGMESLGCLVELVASRTVQSYGKSAVWSQIFEDVELLEHRILSSEDRKTVVSIKNELGGFSSFDDCNLEKQKDIKEKIRQIKENKTTLLYPSDLERMSLEKFKGLLDPVITELLEIAQKRKRKTEGLKFRLELLRSWSPSGREGWGVSDVTKTQVLRDIRGDLEEMGLRESSLPEHLQEFLNFKPRSVARGY